VIQATPPFLIIHTNAQFTRLTGIDAHLVLGKPVSVMFSLTDIEAGQAIEHAHPAIFGEEPVLDEQHEQAEVPQHRLPSPNDDLAAAEASGRARAEANRLDRKEMTLDRLITSSGFGHLHVVCVCTKQHQMVGRNVTVFSDALSNVAPESRTRDEESNDASLTSSVEAAQQPLPLTCRMSIAPIVSSTKVLGVGVFAEKEPESHQKGKRAKHHHGNDQETPQRKYHPLQMVTHYAIQLQPYGETSVKNESMDSLSSTSASVEAHLLGISVLLLQPACQNPSIRRKKLLKIWRQSTKTCWNL
jgi:hypothetical protein